MLTNAELHSLPRNGNEPGVFVQKALVIHLRVQVQALEDLVVNSQQSN